jgi:phage-related holin
LKARVGTAKTHAILQEIRKELKKKSYTKKIWFDVLKALFTLLAVIASTIAAILLIPEDRTQRETAAYIFYIVFGLIATGAFIVQARKLY